ESFRQSRTELEPFLKEQPDNYVLIGDLALANMGLGDKAAAFALAEQAMSVLPLEKDAVDGPAPIEVRARVAAELVTTGPASAASSLIPCSAANFRTSSVIFMLQKCGPHMEQKCAVLAPSCGNVSSWNSRAVSGSSERLS